MIRYLFTLFLTIFTLNLSAAEKTVGVVMSGGGAKGLYHIGVLEALEESGVPIDYVAGTSMGAIIAGLYAAGYSPSEMRKLALSGALEKWVSGKIDVNYGVLFRSGSRLNSVDPAFSVRVDLKENSPTDNATKHNKRRIPKSLISTTQIDMAITELFSSASTASNGDFNNLMIPFLCVASDVANNKKIVITGGDLGEAIRASMAIPLAFKPIMKASGEVLYDGGIQDNFPWRDMQDNFAPDIIVGSVCSVDSWANTDDLSLFDQALFLAMNETDYNLPENGIMIQHDVPVGMLEFDNPSTAMNLGYWDTKLNIYSITSRIPQKELRTEEYYKERRTAFNDKKPDLIFDSYTITGLNKNQEAYVKRYISNSQRKQSKFGAKEERVMDFAHLQNSLYSVLSTGDYTTNLPKLTYDSLSSRYNFSIRMEHKPSLELSLGGNLSSTPFNQIYLGAKYTTIDHVAKSLFADLCLAPVYTTGRLGYRIDFYHNAPVFLDTYFNFAVKNLDHGNFGQLSPINNTMGIKSSEYLLSVGIGAPLKRRSQITFRGNGGVELFKYTTQRVETIDSKPYIFDKSRFRYMAGKCEIERSTIDNILFPNRGYTISGSVIGVLGQETSHANEQFYPIEGIVIPTGERKAFYDEEMWFGAKFSLLRYFNISKDVISLGLHLEGVYTNFPELHSKVGQQMMMPAYQPVSHMQMVYMPEFSAPRYVGLGITPSFKLWRDLSLRLSGYAMLNDDMDNKNETTKINSGVDIKYVFDSSLAYNTQVGPITLSATKYNIGNWDNLYLTFNFGYTIFAPRGTFY